MDIVHVPLHFSSKKGKGGIRAKVEAIFQYFGNAHNYGGQTYSKNRINGAITSYVNALRNHGSDVDQATTLYPYATN